MQVNRYITGILLLAGLGACKKQKADYRYVEPDQPQVLTGSTVRLQNLGRAGTELVINGDTLTSMIPPSLEGLYLADNTRPTAYFTNGRLGSSYTIPQRFIGADGTARLTIGSLGNAQPEPLLYTKSFTIKEDVSHPTDYYNVLFGDATVDIMSTDSLFTLQRSISPPNNPQHFKVRLLNLSSSPAKGNVQGNMSLVFADGTTVSSTTSNIAPGKASEYVEVPYGAYQFKVQDAAGHIVPAVPTGFDESKTINVNNGNMSITTAASAVPIEPGFTCAPLHTFQPGGVYTILVSVNGSFNYYPSGSNVSSPTVFNAFRIITDITEPLNVTYGHVQAVNALPNSQLNVSIDGAVISNSSLEYTKASAYQTLITGKHTLKVQDVKSNTMVDTSFQLTGSDNYSIWVFPGAGGKAVVKMVANNLSGKFYYNENNAGDDGTYDQYTTAMPFWIRFLNLSTDVPEVTFTQANGQPFLGVTNRVSTLPASQHLAQGAVVNIDPYVMLSPSYGASQILAYASRPNVTPGNWLQAVPALKGTDFIARPALYPGQQPQFETGVYTVALVGSLKDQSAKMIIIKHNQ
ncbi:hypothetical protein DCC81_24990 [Chitinophaga parva]|uniref:DUF4397 domain-containing protein n=1 Tax=Chitinophaga parva TaxID=2169414 RepID=A0A2T7BBT0_9BACT|nr:DUF4397 domain-containing protein [Chitinophaga parva]PUZ21846.1 hypothetical protein DCC81_24990 [Chitinophaga parva]